MKTIREKLDDFEYKGEVYAFEVLVDYEWNRIHEEWEVTGVIVDLLEIFDELTNTWSDCINDKNVVEYIESVWEGNFEL